MASSNRERNNRQNNQIKHTPDKHPAIIPPAVSTSKNFRTNLSKPKALAGAAPPRETNARNAAASNAPKWDAQTRGVYLLTHPTNRLLIANSSQNNHSNAFVAWSCRGRIDIQPFQGLQTSGFRRSKITSCEMMSSLIPWRLSSDRGHLSARVNDWLICRQRSA